MHTAVEARLLSPDLLSAEPVRDECLRELHRSRISDARRVREILETVVHRRIRLRSGLNRLAEPRTASIEKLGSDRITLHREGFVRHTIPQLFFAFEIDSTSYFFVGESLPGKRGAPFAIKLPRTIYEAERRELLRLPSHAGSGRPTKVRLAGSSTHWMEADVADWCYDGLGVNVRDQDAANLPERLRVQLVDGETGGQEAHAIVRHRKPSDQHAGWTQLGLSVSAVSRRESVPVQSRGLQSPPRPIHSTSAHAVQWRSPEENQGSRTADRESQTKIQTIEYRNPRGERIRAIVDSWGDAAAAPLVIIPPAWGRTKETLLPLAATILATFRRANQPVTVLRYDGIRRRGESHNDPDCLAPGRECMTFTASQAVEDILTTLDYVETAPEFAPSSIAMVTSSVAAIEARRAIAADLKNRVSCWVSLVGITDLQSALRVFSGGIDYGSGHLLGLRFGPQELLGVLCDMDLMGGDAIEQRMWFLEDARRDMADIDIPISWIHGRHDGWMQLSRVQEILSCGDSSQRTLIEIPTGHQLRTSETADAVFRLVAEEIARMLLGRQIEGQTPNPELLAARQNAERRRLPAPGYDLRRFWRDYLVGRRGNVGIELLTSTNAYAELQAVQIRNLDLQKGDRVVDLGAGTGAFAIHLSRQPRVPADVHIVHVDFVRQGLARAALRLSELEDTSLDVEALVANLDLGSAAARGGIPIQSASQDAVLASLLLGYLEKPILLLNEVHRILKPGGRLVLSSVLTDADLSKIYVESLMELPRDRITELFGLTRESDIDQLRQDFLNDASRIIDLEEFGIFHFFNQEELTDLTRAAGFAEIKVEPTFGFPPQALVVAARRA